MDLRVAGESAIFGVAEVKRGLFPLGGSTVRLRRQIPYTDRGRAAAHRPADVRASEAKDVGLIGHVVPDGQALAKAQELAAEIAANGPLAVQAVLKSLRESANLGEQEALANELELGWPDLRDQRREGRPHRLQREAEPRFTGTSGPSGGFALGRPIPSERAEQPVGLRPTLVEIADEPEAEEPRQRALQVEGPTDDGDGDADQGQHDRVALLGRGVVGVGAVGQHVGVDARGRRR